MCCFSGHSIISELQVVSCLQHHHQCHSYFAHGQHHHHSACAGIFCNSKIHGFNHHNKCICDYNHSLQLTWYICSCYNANRSHPSMIYSWHGLMIPPEHFHCDADFSGGSLHLSSPGQPCT